MKGTIDVAHVNSLIPDTANHTVVYMHHLLENIHLSVCEYNLARKKVFHKTNIKNQKIHLRFQQYTILKPR